VEVRSLALTCFTLHTCSVCLHCLLIQIQQDDLSLFLSSCLLFWLVILTAHNLNSVWPQIKPTLFLFYNFSFTLSSATPLPPSHQQTLLIFTLRVLHCPWISKVHLTLSIFQTGRSFSNIYKTTPYLSSKVLFAT